MCLHFAWTPLERQVVVYGRAEKLSLAESTKYFLSRPRNSQLAAWTSQQSRTIGSRKLLEQAFEQIKHKFGEGEIPMPAFWAEAPTVEGKGKAPAVEASTVEAPAVGAPIKVS